MCEIRFGNAKYTVFRKIFFVDDRERESLELDYSSTILKILIEYCYSDVLDLDPILDAESMTDEEATLMIELRHAATHFGLSDVANHLSNEIGQAIFHNGEIESVCAILMALNKREETNSPFWNVLIQLVINKPDSCLCPKLYTESNKGIKACPLSLLMQILAEVQNTYVVVCCLKEWVEETNITDSLLSPHDQKLLSDFANGLDLKSIHIPKLSALEPCSLFPMERLYEAFVHQGSQNSEPQSPILHDAVYVSSGALECLNGYYYKRMSVIRHCYFKKGVFEGEKVEFTIELVDDMCTLSGGPENTPTENACTKPSKFRICVSHFSFGPALKDLLLLPLLLR